MRLKGVSLIALMAATLVAAPVYATPAPVVKKFQDAIAQTKASMMTDPAAALSKARAAEAIATTMPEGKDAQIAKATSAWLSSEALTRLGEPERAKPLVVQALTIVRAQQPGSKLHADLLKSNAAIASKTGNIQAALPLLHNAFSIYQKLGETRSQAIILQNIGSLYYDARSYQRALHYYDQAASVYKDDPAVTVSLHNNRGSAFNEMGNFSAAEKQYADAIKVASQMNSPFLLASVLSNLASAQIKNGDLAAAQSTISRGLRLASGDKGLNAAFYGAAANIAFRTGRNADAARQIATAFAGLDIENTTMEQRDNHEIASQIYGAIGEPALAYRHLRAFKRLDDKGRDLAASTNDALMSAQFDAANQKLRISKLEAQKVQKELALEQSQNKLKSVAALTILGGLAASAVLLAMMYAVATSRRRRREISEANVQLTYAANHDLLTGLPNRAYFRELAGNAITEAVQSGHSAALLLVDLDRFKWVNDTLGHNAGDELLKIVANILKDLAGEQAHAVRLGGDEFAIIIPHVSAEAHLMEMGARIVERLSAPQDVSGSTVSIGATVGVALAPEDGHDVTTLTRAADLALYAGKGAGRGRTTRYGPDMQRRVDDKRILEHDLRHALERGEIRVAYQAIYDAHKTSLVGYEALLRWEHPERGAISPSQFIPIAEEAGLINAIGDWVLKTACAEAVKWPEHINLAVNLSAIQVEGQGLVSHVVNALAVSGLRSDRLELEVTESVFLHDDGKANETLQQLRTLGVNLALDDFGTGFSSLGYLRRAEFSTIKIDRSFVKSANGGSQDSLAIIRAIISLANDLGMITTAEGVETVEELELMRTLGCVQIQGYLFSRPTHAPSIDHFAEPIRGRRGGNRQIKAA